MNIGSSTQCRFIKNLLKNTYLPTLACVSVGDYINLNNVYIFGNKIIRCTESGVLGGFDYGFACGPTQICSNKFICGVGVRTAKYEVVKEYIYNGFVPGETTKFKNATEVYDLDTHRVLGDYLRWKSSVYKLPLMGLYNCFFPNVVHTVCIKNVAVEGSKEDILVSESPDPARKVFAVPLKFGKMYKVYFPRKEILKYRISFLDPNTYELADIKVSGTADRLDGAVFGAGCVNYTGDGEPLMMSTQIPDKMDYPKASGGYTTITYTDILKWEKFLFLIIDVDASMSKNILVSEYPYLTDTEIFRTSAYIEPILSPSSVYGGEVPATVQKDLSLLQFEFLSNLVNVCSSLIGAPAYAPFSDSLLGYLASYYVANDVEIPNNVRRVHEKMRLKLYEGEHPDVWNDYTGIKVYTKHLSVPPGRNLKSDHCKDVLTMFNTAMDSFDYRVVPSLDEVIAQLGN